MRLDPDHTRQLYDAGWVDGYDQGQLDGFRAGYRAAIAAAGEPLEQIPSRAPRRRAAPRATGVGADQDSGGATPVERARRSWQLPAPDHDPGTSPSRRPEAPHG